VELLNTVDLTCVRIGSVLDNKFASNQNNVDRCSSKVDLVEKLGVQRRARFIDKVRLSSL
jgi:DNA-directed RNA polymerase subunit N (RpoN/RPB10)